MAARSNARVMWRMLGLARPLAGWMVLAVACGVAGFCCATGVPVLAAEAALVAVGVGSLPWALGVTVAVLAVMAVARGVLHYMEQRCNHYIAFKLLAHVRDLVFGALRRLTPAKLAGSDSGALISTVTSDVELLEVFYAHTISPICIAVLMAVVMGAFLGGIHPALAAMALASYALVGIAVPVAVSRASGGKGGAAETSPPGFPVSSLMACAAWARCCSMARAFLAWRSSTAGARSWWRPSASCVPAELQVRRPPREPSWCSPARRCCWLRGLPARAL